MLCGGGEKGKHVYKTMTMIVTTVIPSVPLYAEIPQFHGRTNKLRRAKDFVLGSILQYLWRSCTRNITRTQEQELFRI
jgi:hypothetical protein